MCKLYQSSQKCAAIRKLLITALATDSFPLSPVNTSMPEGAITAGQTNTVAEEKKPKCKACCACPETKQVRDACIVEKGAENCLELIEAHKKCMREMGFNV